MTRRCGLIALFTVAALAMTACQPSTIGAERSPGAPTGRSAGTGEACGGFVGIACRVAGDFCRMPTGACQVADGMGTCTPRRPICTREYRPVCGCDGRTYGNACEANAAGVSLAAEGTCPQA